MGDKVREAAQALMDALDRTNWSSWQTTAGFSEQCGALRAALAAPPQEQAPGWMPIETAPRGSGEDGPRRRKRRSARSPVPEAFERSKDQWINLNG